MANVVTIKGKEYSLDDFSGQLRDRADALVYVEKRIKELNEELAITKTAINAYGLILSEKMPKPAHANKKKDVIRINGKKYALADFDEGGKSQVYSIHKAQAKQTQLEADIAIATTARSAYKTDLSGLIAKKLTAK